MLQNRVDPWGSFWAIPDRGTRMGNRGILHNEENHIVKQWAHRSWVSCLLQFGNIKRQKPFSAGNYSELFFLDEATSFAAGHRPCSYCQRAKSKLFKEKWFLGNISPNYKDGLTVVEIDKVSHNDRTLPGWKKKTYQAQLAELPFGTLFEYNTHAYLVAKKGYYQWSFAGYEGPTHIEKTSEVSVLTLKSVVEAFKAGLVPDTHPTLGHG